MEKIRSILMQNLEKPKSHADRIMALCPFHDDKNPSLAVYLDDNPHYHCFGCGAHGNINELFDKLGINMKVEIPRTSKVSRKRYEDVEPFQPTEVNHEHLLELSEKYFKNLNRITLDEYLRGTKITINSNHKYWIKRGISVDTLAKMAIGCGKDSRGFFYSVPYWWVKPTDSLRTRNFNVVAIKKIYPYQGKNGKDSYGFYPLNNSVPLYNEPALVYAKQQKKKLGIFEGEKDTLLAIEQGILGIGIAGKNGMKESFIPLFEGIPEVILWLDNDADKKMDEIIQMFDAYRSKYQLPQVKKFNWDLFVLPKGSDYTDLVNLNLIGSGISGQ